MTTISAVRTIICRVFSATSSGPVACYAAALVIFIIALIIRMVILPANAGVQFLTFYPAMALTALFYGSGPSLLVIALGGCAGYYVFTEPYWAFKFNYGTFVSLSVYTLSSIVISLIVHRSRQTEKKLSLLAAIVDSSEDAIVGKTLDGVITNWNPAAERLFGYAAVEAIGKLVSTLYPPGLLNDERDLLACIARGDNVSRFETVRIRKDGSAVDVSVTLSAIRDKNGRIVGASKIAHDITARKAMEYHLNQLNRQLTMAIADLERSNQELDDFAFIASHDLKEPLRGIHNYVSFLQEDCASQLNDDGRNYLDRIQRLAERLATLIDRLLAYSRVGSAPLHLESVSVDAVLDEVLEDLKHTLSTAGVTVRRVDPLPTVTGSAMWLGEVFQNLITNAAKYNDKSEKWIEVGCDLIGAVPVFYVRDNGIGIAEQHLTIIFRIFKRLHDQNKFGGGSGAGLTIVKKIVERHGGRIWVESELGVGSCFRFTLTAAA